MELWEDRAIGFIQVCEYGALGSYSYRNIDPTSVWRARRQNNLVVVLL